MFGKKKRELEARQRAEERIQLQQALDQSIQNASAIKDPAVKIIELNKIDNNINALIWSEKKDIDSKAEHKSQKIDTIGSTITTAGGIAALSLIAGPVAWVGLPIMVAGGAGAEFLAGKRKKALKKQFEAVSKNYLQNLKDLSGLISEITKVTVENNVQELSQSPLYKKVLDLPGLTEIYAAAAAKHIGADKQQPADSATPVTDKADAPAEKKLPAPPPHKKRPPPSYDELKGL